MSIRPMMLLAVLPLTVAAAPIEVAVTNVTQAKGKVHVDICSEKLFMGSDCLYSADAPAVIGTTIVTIPNVPPGHYAAQVFHDIDGSGKLKRNLFGIPKEPVGFSRDAPIHFAPPKWADAMFDHGTESQRITLSLRTKFF
ncbi:DUF2141 domain-containing protein [Sphingomonas abietis]|uniref:DUF2141 domain-containing protein n=1 Tax=Sphingomonas abietis TaxID=3012344 RepID=A0ABY7NNA4_9SPHN|nr:DUF2141 domain-containing protein [Sphingomonas abietis]WBO23006.1 DUF2141 domain-containing protein [Sphingomonas abietis]